MLILQVAVFLSGVFGAFFFAGVETGFVSWNPLKVGYQARQGKIFAKWALYLIKYKERVLSMVLIGNNLCIVGASLSFLYLFSRLNQLVQFDLDKIPSPETWFLSPVLVVFSEILSKSLFRIYSFRLTMKSMPILIILYWLTLPITWIFSVFGTLLQKNVQTGKIFMTNMRKEMVLVAQEVSKQGKLFEYATLFINNILNLKDKTIGDIMIADEGYFKELCFVGSADKKKARISDTISNICGNEYLSEGENVLVFDKDGKMAVGWISLLDIAKADNNATVGTIIRQLPEIDKNTSLLSCFSKNVDFQYPFYRIIDKHDDTGAILDRFNMFRLVFEGDSTS